MWYLFGKTESVWEFVEEVAHLLHTSGDVADIGEILAEFLPEGLAEALPHAVVGALEVAGEFCPIIAAFAFPIFAGIKWVNALEFGQRLIGLRAVAYGMTAWVFEEAVPAPPPWIRANMSPGSLHGPR
jgi:hypothetical protein